MNGQQTLEYFCVSWQRVKELESKFKLGKLRTYWVIKSKAGLYNQATEKWGYGQGRPIYASKKW